MFQRVCQAPTTIKECPSFWSNSKVRIIWSQKNVSFTLKNKYTHYGFGWIRFKSYSFILLNYIYKNTINLPKLIFFCDKCQQTLGPQNENLQRTTHCEGFWHAWVKNGIQIHDYWTMHVSLITHHHHHHVRHHGVLLGTKKHKF